MLAHRQDKNRPNTTAANSVSRTTYEPALLTDVGIKQWAQEQENYAKGMSHSDPRYGDASLMLSYVAAIHTLLAQPPSAELQRRIEKRQQELVREFRLEWHDLKPTTEPPMAVLIAKARGQAYAETRSDIMALVQRIIALRRRLELPNDRRRIHYRPVKRLR